MSVITEAPWQNERLDVPYSEVKKVVSVPRGVGLWGDMVRFFHVFFFLLVVLSACMYDSMYDCNCFWIVLCIGSSSTVVSQTGLNLSI